MKRNSNRGGNNSERQKSIIFHGSEGRGREGRKELCSGVESGFECSEGIGLICSANKASSNYK
jgi:hypothetical protein